MDLKLLLTTFATVFLAEMGDKTQLATFALATGARSWWAVFLGSALALVASSAIAVLGADAVTRIVPAFWLRRAAGALMVGLGAILLLRRGG
jgi:Ca2+/H+ antiporter, TMEM165/GDT1 family